MPPSPLQRLKAAIAQQPELPATLAAELLTLAATASAGPDADEALLAELARQVEDYDPYAGAGCFGDACSLATIEATLRRLTSRR